MHQLVSYYFSIHISPSRSCYVMLDLGNCKLHFLFVKWIPIMLSTISSTTWILECWGRRYTPLTVGFQVLLAIASECPLNLVENCFNSSFILFFPSNSQFLHTSSSASSFPVVSRNSRNGLCCVLSDHQKHMLKS